MLDDSSPGFSETDTKQPQTVTTEYCEKLQQWMWQYYTGCSPASWGFLPAFLLPQTPDAALSTSAGDHQAFDIRNWYSYPSPLSPPTLPQPPPYVGVDRTERSAASAADARAAQQQNGDTLQAGKAVCLGCCSSSMHQARRGKRALFCQFKLSL